MPILRSPRNDGSALRCDFFFSDLIDSLTLEELRRQAYILVSKCNFSYSDVKKMVSTERITFINLYIEDIKQQQEEALANANQ